MTNGAAGSAGSQLPEARTDDELDLESRAVKLAGQWTELALKQVIGFGALALMVIQIIAADVVFVLYAVNNDWHLPVAAITGWLAATVIQVVGVVLVVTQGLFSQD